MTRPTDQVALERDLRLGAAHYRLLVRSGPDGWGDLARELTALDADRVLLVTDDRAPVAAVRAGLARLPLPITRLRPARTLSGLDGLAEQALAAGATRRTVVLGAVGRTAGRTAGLLAALLLQGLRLVQLPTTLAAMCGSALSPRHQAGSGALGTWYPPTLVFCRLDLFDLLDPDRIRADLAEPIRHVLAICPGHHDRFAARLRPDARYGPRELAAFVALCADARSAVTCYDPLERGPGLALSYGRTAGRAVRRLVGPAYPEGHADALGMLLAARVAGGLGLLDPDGERAHHELLGRAGLPVELPTTVRPAELPAAVERVLARDGHPGLLLLAAPGHPYCADGSLLTRVDGPTLLAAAGALGAGGRLGLPVPGARGAAVPVPART